MKDVIDNIHKGYIKKSQLHGFGLFASEKIECQECIGVLDGQIISWEQYKILSEKFSTEINEKTIFMEWNAIDKNTLLTRAFRTKYSYINHSRTPNLELKTEPLRIVALRTIDENEELLLDYRKENLSEEYLEGHGKTYL